MAEILFDTPFISPVDELLAYEYLWAQPGSSFKNIAEKLSTKNKLPSELIENDLFAEDDSIKKNIRTYIEKKISQRPVFSVLLKESPQYPDRLLEAKYPVDLLYYRGNPDLINTRCISIVGAREISADGIRRTERLVKELAEKQFTIVSGLAKGTDTVALTTAINCKLNVIGVIGTPIDEYYPKENEELQEKIANEHLLISQVPFYKYSVQPFQSKRVYFVERNATMAAISLATVIVEASDTSGSLTQARACFEQGKGRKLFILNSCFENTNISWPKKYESMGAIRVHTTEDILNNL